MVRIQSEIKRGILRSLWRASQAGQVGLHACLDGFQNASWSAIQSGQILISGSGGGYNSSLKIPGLSDQITQENFLALSEEYLNLYYSAIIYLLQEAYPNDSWTQITALVSSGAYNYSDSQIFVMMIEDDRLQGVREQLGDWTGLNIPSLGGIPAGASA